jgi:DNA-binding HxlR family transcriptional regulator
MQQIVVTPRKAVTFRKVCTFAAMKIIEDEVLPAPEECARSLRSILDALYVLNGKWKIALILSMMQSSKRFNEIRNEISGISPKVLAKELKDLELNGFIRRNVYPTTPVTIIYEATDYSRTLRNVIRELSMWGEQHREKIKESMRRPS